MVKAIIFDLNGVFVTSRLLSDRFKEDFNVSGDVFLPALKEIMAQVRQPGADELYSYWQPYFKEWKIDLSKEEFTDYWFKAEKEVPEMVGLARELREKGIKIFILSNNLKERAGYYRENFPFLEEISDKLYYSWQTGFIKPDEGAYQQILDDFNLKPEECIYFDDSKKNVEVAQGLGIMSYLFEDINETQKVLGEFI